MAKSVEFRAKVYNTSDKKELKSGKHTYEYGTISIRDARLTPLVGQTVVVKVYPSKQDGDGKES